MIRFSLPVLLLAAAFTMSGCDASFEPFAESNLSYSVYGYLDATADTQWVRVEPLRDSVLVGTGPFDARVTTTNVATGERVVWRDSIFRLSSGIAIQNYYTTADLEPEVTYRFTVEGAAGRAVAEVTLPPDFPLPQVTTPPNFTTPEPESTVVFVRGVERLGGALARYAYQLCFMNMDGICAEYLDQARKFSHLDDATRRVNGTIEIPIDWEADLRTLFDRPTSRLTELYSFRVTVASVSEDWPSYDQPLREPGEPPPAQPPVTGTASNIENGVGFLGGAVTKTVEVPLFGDVEQAFLRTGR